MQDLQVETGTVVDVERFDTSKMGNPRYIMTVQDLEGNLCNYYTPVNSSLGYTATNYYNKQIEYTSRYIRNKLCIDSIKLV